MLIADYRERAGCRARCRVQCATACVGALHQARHSAPGTRHPALFLVLSLLSALPAAAQDTTAAPRPARAVSDTIYRKAPVSPMGAFFRSLLVPGWGQAKLDRRMPAGIFLAWEGVTLGMALKADRELQYLKQRGDSTEAIDDKRQEREDWIILLAFNHLFAGLEAYVASHLWDFPEELELRASPRGVGAVVTVPIRIR